MSRSASATAAETHLPRLVLTAGDPAGIGPDLCVTIAQAEWPAAIAVAGDPAVLATRAQMLGLPLDIRTIDAKNAPERHRPGTLQVYPCPVSQPVTAGKPSPAHARPVLRSIDLAVSACLHDRADAMVTAPVAKSVIADAGFPFRGHTEYIALACGGVTPVMLLCSGPLRVALVTTHMPLADVPGAITAERLDQTLAVLHGDLVRRFRIAEPHILVCGLNPHAGESGHLGREEILVIEPVLDRLRQSGMRLTGPLPADTLFLPERLNGADAVLAMYHDQGLPVLKHAAFGNAVNVTLGLPILRTSVDHGTAFDIAGSGTANAGSLVAAMKLALELA